MIDIELISILYDPSSVRKSLPIHDYACSSCGFTARHPWCHARTYGIRNFNPATFTFPTVSPFQAPR